MSDSKIHDERKVKNYLLLGLLVLFVIVVFAVTMVKLSTAFNGTNSIAASEEANEKEK